MSIKVRCQECGQGYLLKPALAGQVVPCRECRADLTVPGRRSRGELRPGRSSAELRTPGGPIRSREESNRSSIPPGVWIGGGVGLLLLVIALGVFLVIRNSGTTAEGAASADLEEGESADDAFGGNSWPVPPFGAANLGEEIALGPYSIRVPKGWMPANSNYGGGRASIEWKWPDPSLDAKLQFTVKLDPKYIRGDEPQIITEGGRHRLEPTKDHYIFTGADPPEKGRINGVVFHRVNFPETRRGQSISHSEFIAILDGALVEISTDVKLPKHMKLCQHAEAAALSFKKNATVPPVLTLDEINRAESEYVKGFPKPRVISGNLADWGFESKHRFLGEPEFVILMSDEDVKSAVISTPRPNYVAIRGVVYSLLDQGKEVGRFQIPAELQKLRHKALRDDGKMMAFADRGFTREGGKIHLLSEGGNVWKFLQERQTRSAGSIRLEFIRFLPGNHLAAGWRFRKPEVDVYNLETGDQKQIALDSSESDSVGFSRDGRFLVGTDAKTNKLALVLIDNPRQMTELRPPADARLLFFHLSKGFQFSPDGNEIAGIVSGRLMCWSIKGQLLFDTKLPAEWASFYDDDGPALEWTSDGSGWLVWGRFLLDRKDSKVRWSLPKPKSRFNLYQHNRILEDGRLLITQGDEETPFGFAVYPKIAP